MRHLIACLLLLFCIFPIIALAELPRAIDVQAAAVSDSSPSSTPIVAGTLSVDFSQVSPDDPSATPIAIDPIDKPTPTPMPTANFLYETYTNEQMGISFKIPYTWLLNPRTNLSSTIQFVEPKSEIMDEAGYQTRLTIEYRKENSPQTVSDARSRLESVLEELAGNFTTFTPGNIASATFGPAKGSYCYYNATYDDGTKTYQMKGRIVIVAYGSSLYQVRLTAPRSWYSYYEVVYRHVRSSIQFQ